MNTLADIALEHFCLLMFSDAVNPDDAASLMQPFSTYLASMTPDEQVAFSAAARRALEHLLAEPDEHGYSPRQLVSEDERKFLELAAAGEIFHG